MFIIKVCGSLWKIRIQLFGLLYFTLYLIGLNRYAGSAFSYNLFSVVFLIMLVSGFVRHFSYGYVFLVVMLWLGFWLKMTFHLWIEYPYQESIGLFDGSSNSWDEVLAAATAGATGVIAGRLLFIKMGKVTSPDICVATRKTFPILDYYSRWRWKSWLVLFVLFIGIVILNLTLGIIQVGLVPRTILPWPLNALISWFLTYGIFIFIVTFLWWDILLQRDARFALYMVAIESFFSATSLLSRGAYLFHVVPTYWAAFNNKKMIMKISIKSIILLGFVVISLFIISFSLSNIYREYIYSDKPVEANKISGIGGVISRLAVDRWIGLEGMMVIQAQPNKSANLLLDGLREKREIGKNTMYVELSRPVYYSVVDKSKFQFTEIPGPIAFWWYSGSLWMVMVGLFILVVFVQGAEILVMKLTSNPILCAVLGGLMANTVAQFGVAPRSSMSQIFTTGAGVLLIGFIQSPKLVNLISNYFRISKNKNI